MFHGEQGRLREVFGDRPVRIWRWGWHRRFRFADWMYAGVLFLWVASVNLTSIDQPSPGVGWDLLFDVLRWWSWLLGWPTGLVLGLVSGLVIPSLAALTVLVRRNRPRWLLGVALVLLVVLGNPAAIPLALYSYAVWFTDRRSLAMWTAAMLAGMVSALGFGAGVVPLVLQSILLIVLPLTFGLWVGTRGLLIANLRERAERLEREQHLEAQRALAAERTRIAREMHDVVAHRVSLMVVHAGGLEVSTSDERAIETAALIRGTGREALTELREILGVLRDDPDLPATTIPQPVLADLGELVEGWRGAGMAVALYSTGKPGVLPAQLERTVYRTVQEGLTNAAKHAPGVAVTVRLTHGPDTIEVRVANEPPPASERLPPAPSSGFGLAGLRERLALVGGTLTAGPSPDGTWELRAAIPAATATRGQSD